MRTWQDTCRGSLQQEGMKEKPSRGQGSSITNFQHFPLHRSLNSFKRISRTPCSKFMLIIGLFSWVTLGLRGICPTQAMCSREPWRHQPKHAHAMGAASGCGSGLDDQHQPPAMHVPLPHSPPRARMGPGAAPTALGTARDRGSGLSTVRSRTVTCPGSPDFAGGRACRDAGPHSHSHLHHQNKAMRSGCARGSNQRGS